MILTENVGRYWNFVILCDIEGRFSLEKRTVWIGVGRVVVPGNYVSSCCHSPQWYLDSSVGIDGSINHFQSRLTSISPPLFPRILHKNHSI